MVHEATIIHGRWFNVVEWPPSVLTRKLTSDYRVAIWDCRTETRWLKKKHSHWIPFRDRIMIQNTAGQRKSVQIHKDSSTKVNLSYRCRIYHLEMVHAPILPSVYRRKAGQCWSGPNATEIPLRNGRWTHRQWGKVWIFNNDYDAGWQT